MNLKSIVSSSVLSGMIAVIAMAPTTANATSDGKQYHASGGCKVYGATPWTALGYGWQGVANSSGAAQYIICPIVTDSDAAWVTASTNAYVHFHSRTGSVAATITCVIFTSFADGLVATDTVSMVLPANTTNNGGQNSGYLTNYSGSDGAAMILCQLPAQATLAHYYVWEGSTTNTP